GGPAADPGRAESLQVAWAEPVQGSRLFDHMFEYYSGTGPTRRPAWLPHGGDYPRQGEDMFTALAGNAGHPAVAALLWLGAGGVVAMAWSVHVRQIRLAERLARRQFLVMPDSGAAGQHGSPAAGEPAGRPNGTGVPGNAPANGTTSPGNGTMPHAGGAATAA